MKPGKKSRNSTNGWTPEFRKQIVADIAAKHDPYSICAKHDISMEQLTKLIKREEIIATVRGGVNIKQALEDYRQVVMRRLPELAMTLPDDVKTAEFLRKSAVDLGLIGQVAPPEEHQPLFVLPSGSKVAIAIKTGGTDGTLEAEISPSAVASGGSPDRSLESGDGGEGRPEILRIAKPRIDFPDAVHLGNTSNSGE